MRKLYGREKEIFEFASAMNNQGETKLIAVSGLAGMGKTALVTHSLAVQRRAFILAQSKFSQTTTAFPYQALYEIILDLESQLQLYEECKNPFVEVMHQWQKIVSGFLPQLASKYQIEVQRSIPKEDYKGELLDLFKQVIAIFSAVAPLSLRYTSLLMIITVQIPIVDCNWSIY